MKLVWRILIGVVAVFGLLVAGAILFVDSIARKAVEAGGTQALGVPTELDSASIGLFSGDFGLTGLKIANPPGFGRPEFLSLREAKLELSLGSLLSERVSVPLFELRGIAVDLERNSQGTNYGVLLDHLSRFESDETPPPESEAPAASARTFSLEKLVLRDIQATIDLLPVGGEATKVSLSIPEIVVEKIASDLTVAQICSLVVRTVLEAAIQNGANLLPDELLADLRGRMKGLESRAGELSSQAAKEAQSALEDAAKGLGGEAGKALQEAGGKLEGLLKKKMNP